MTQHSRRDFCLALTTSLLLAACGDAFSTAKSIKRTEPMKPLSDEEFALISDPKARNAALGDAPLTISHRVIGSSAHRLDDTSIENINFVNCDFIGHFMFNVDMKNISFTGCVIHGVRWEGGQWNDMSFRGCVGKGRNSLKGASMVGSTLYEDCKFWGIEPDNPNDLDSLGWCGEISVPGNGRVINCDFVRMIVYCGLNTEFSNCRFTSGALNTFREYPANSLAMTNCSNPRIFQNTNMSVRKTVLKDCSFAYAEFIRLKGDSVTLDKMTGSFDFSASQLREVKMLNCILASDEKLASVSVDEMGFWAISSAVEHITLESCSFKGKTASLNLHGRQPELDKNGKIIPRNSGAPYISTLDTLTLRNTPLINTNLSYTKIKQITLDGVMFKDGKLTNSSFDKLILKNTTLAGKLDFSGTKVKEVVTENITREAGLSIVKTNGEVAL